MTFSEIALIIVCITVATLMIGGVCWLVIGRYRKFRDAALSEISELFEKYHVEAPSVHEKYVDIHFYLYHGLLNTLTTTQINWRVNSDRALDCLKQLRNFNFKRGLYGPAAFLVPFSTFYHYIKQKRRILKGISR